MLRHFGTKAPAGVDVIEMVMRIASVLGSIIVPRGPLFYGKEHSIILS